MDIQLIDCGKITFPTTDQGEGRFNTRTAQEIANDIKADRKIHPIVIRLDPGNPGHYLGIQGRHRHHAMHFLLKKPSIACHVLTMDDAEATLAAITENLFRHDLHPTERSRSIRRWYEHFRALYPERVGKGKAGGAARKKKAQDSKQAKAKLAFASHAQNGQAGATKVENQTTPNFTQRLAAATGVSQTTAKRELRLALNLTTDQLEVCGCSKLNKGQIASIANIKEPSQRKKVVDQIAKGRGFDEAWRQVNPKAKKASGKSGAQEAAEAAASQEEQPDLSDADWFQQSCGDKAKMIPNPGRFRADALVFRRLSRLRHLFRTKAKATLETFDLGPCSGPLIKVVQVLMALAHPNEWPVCVFCNGHGEDEVGKECSRCSGAGYLLESPAATPTTIADVKRDDRSADSIGKPDPSPPMTLAVIDAVPDLNDPYGDEYLARLEEVEAETSEARR
jgi:ParB-like chromosome segregation protein Spo0J